MIISVEQIKQFVDFGDWTDAKIEMKLRAIEQTIRAYTNNNFQVRGYRVPADIEDGILYTNTPSPFNPGDTVEISESDLNAGVYTVETVDGEAFTLSEGVADERGVLVTKVVYPADILSCCVNLMEWEKNQRGKTGIQSETLSRHSVTYFNPDSAGGSMVMGYPASILGVLKAYRKARC